MLLTVCPVVSVESVGAGIFVLTFSSRDIARSFKPGQFVNIRVNDSSIPFLRRPFSIYRAHLDDVQIIFNTVGVGTSALAAKRPGDTIDVLGPLGQPFRLEDDFKTAVLVAGGLGVAPLPALTGLLEGRKEIITLLGARSKDSLVANYLRNVHASTDDGSAGFHGTVVGLLKESVKGKSCRDWKIFACGPNAMLRSLAAVAGELQLPCEMSLESVMACGIGICQGCPVERRNADKKYSLVCKEGPVFESTTLHFT